MSASEVRSVVVGAGAAGLGAALALQAQGAETVVLEAGPRVGGVMQSERQGGFLFERGPNTIRVHGPALSLLRAAGVEAALLAASPASRHRYLLRESGLVPVPMDPLAFARTPLLSPRGRLRILAEPFQRRGDGADETVAEFVGRRLGPEASESLVGPFLVGVYAGDERRLGAEAVFPTLVALEREGGSITAGALKRLLKGGRERGLSGTFSARDGLGGLAAVLARQLRGPVLLETRVESLAPDGDGWRLALRSKEGTEELRAREVVLACDAAATARLLQDVDADAARLVGSVEYAPLASVALSVAPEAAAVPIEGFGFLVPRDCGIDVLGILFMSRLFPGRAPEGRELLTAMIGGVRWPEAAEASDEVLLERAHEGLRRALGLRGDAEILAVSRWPRAVPQPGPDHARLVRELRRRVAARPGLALAGCYLDGVGVADTLACGARAARDLARR